MTTQNPSTPANTDSTSQTAGRRGIWIALACSVIAIAVVSVSNESVRTALAQAYKYSAGATLDDATSWTMTYLLFTPVVATVGFAIFAIPVVQRSKVMLWIGALCAVFALAVAIYNLTQPFPLVAQISGFLPVIGGVCVLYPAFASAKKP